MSPRMGLDLNMILQTAAEAANKEGIDEVTLASLAKKLHIRPPSLYNHLQGLQDLKKKLGVYGLEKLYIALAEAVIGCSGDEAVHALGKGYVAFVRTHPGLYEAILRSAEWNDKEIQKAADKIVHLVVKVLDVYELEEETALHTVRCLRSMLHGFASLEQSGGFGLPLDTDVSLQFLIDTFLAGLHMKNLNKSTELNPINKN